MTESCSQSTTKKKSRKRKKNKGATKNNVASSGSDTVVTEQQNKIPKVIVIPECRLCGKARLLWRKMIFDHIIHVES